MKKIIGIAALIFTIAMPLWVQAAQGEYIPLRKTFEAKGYDVIWSSDAPDKVSVKVGEQEQIFKLNTNEIEVDEGVFHTENIAYLDNNTTYISKDAVSLSDNLYLYHKAIEDAKTPEESEILPLYTIDTSLDKVLVCTWHKYPDSYPTGEDVIVNWGDVWVFTADEVIKSTDRIDEGDNFELRMEQLIGLPPQNGKTSFTLMWVDPDNLYRPAPDRDISSSQATLDFPENTDDEYKVWFEEQAKYSYYPHRYPWTGLGYTYDWADNGTEYGFSEYILKDGSEAKVERTFTNDEFKAYLDEMSLN